MEIASKNLGHRGPLFLSCDFLPQSNAKASRWRTTPDAQFCLAERPVLLAARGQPPLTHGAPGQYPPCP